MLTRFQNKFCSRYMSQYSELCFSLLSTAYCVYSILDCCHGKQRAQLWIEPRGAGEDRTEVQPRPGAAFGGLDTCTVRGTPGEATARERELPEMANGWDCEWLASTQNRSYY